MLTEKNFYGNIDEDEEESRSGNVWQDNKIYRIVDHW